MLSSDQRWDAKRLLGQRPPGSLSLEAGRWPGGHDREVASTSTAWRVLVDSIGPGLLVRLTAATSRARTKVWDWVWRLSR